MRIRFLFGCLFFLLSIIFCGFQLATLPKSDPLQASPLLLQFSSTVVCLLLASLAAESGHKTVTAAISVTAFSVCFVALLSGGILAIRAAGDMAPLKYIIFLVYAGFYGAFGLAFSLMTGNHPVSEPGQNA